MEKWRTKTDVERKS